MKNSIEGKISKHFLKEVKSAKSKNSLEARIMKLVNSNALTAKMKIGLLGEALLELKGAK